MARKAVAVGVAKANLPAGKMFVLAMLAGAFIAFGACFYTTAVTGIPAALVGPARILGGLAFSLGLILVVVGGAELFTGNVLMLMALASRRIGFGRMLRNWCIVYVGNLAGSLVIAALVFYAGQWKMGECAVGATACATAIKKVGLPFSAAACSGMLCNMLVCLAVWLCYAGRSAADKVLAIIFPITAFVALGFEHSVANMFFIPYGMLVSHIPAVASTDAVQHLAYKTHPSHVLSVHAFLVYNLLPVTLGNIVGGGLFVGIAYWLAYLRGAEPEVEQAAPLITAEPIGAIGSMDRQA